MYALFRGCRKIGSVNVSNWNVSNVTKFTSMFSHTNLKTVGDLERWNMHSAKDIGAMFMGSSELISVGNISKWVLGKCEEMDFFMSGCKKLKTIGDVSKWNIRNISNFEEAWSCCPELKLDLRTFITKIQKDANIENISRLSPNIIL